MEWIITVKEEIEDLKELTIIEYKSDCKSVTKNFWAESDFIKQSAWIKEIAEIEEANLGKISEWTIRYFGT